MGQAKRRRDVAATRADLPRDAIAAAVRRAVVAVASRNGVIDGLCGLHAAVGQRLLRDRYGVETSLVAGDFQRRINDRVVHSYALGGERIDASAGACHVWLVDDSSRSVIDFDAWEEPVRYEGSGQPHGPWTAVRPDYYWTLPDGADPGLVKVLPNRRATDYVLARLLTHDNARFVMMALAEAVALLLNAQA